MARATRQQTQGSQNNHRPRQAEKQLAGNRHGASHIIRRNHPHQTVDTAYLLRQSNQSKLTET